MIAHVRRTVRAHDPKTMNPTVVHERTCSSDESDKIECSCESATDSIEESGKVRILEEHGDFVVVEKISPRSRPIVVETSALSIVDDEPLLPPVGLPTPEDYLELRNFLTSWPKPTWPRRRRPPTAGELVFLRTDPTKMLETAWRFVTNPTVHGKPHCMLVKPVLSIHQMTRPKWADSRLVEGEPGQVLYPIFPLPSFELRASSFELEQREQRKQREPATRDRRGR